jgi:hypothetical protein
MTKLYFTEKELVDHLEELGVSVSLRWLQDRRIKGGGIPYKKLGGHIRYSRKSVDGWLESQPEFTSTADEAMKKQRHKLT